MPTNRPLALVSQETLLDPLLQLAAAAGCELERAPDVAAARRQWAAAPLILLDAESAAEFANADLPHHANVLVLSTTDPPPNLWQTAVAVHAETVITLPAEEALLISALSDAADRPAATAGHVCAVLGGRGGAGASVLAAAIALTALRRGRSALLVDCDPLGGGVDLLFGAEADVGLRWPDLHIHGGRVPAAALRSALPGRSAGNARLALVSCGRDGPGPAPDAVAAVVAAGRRAGDTVICDLPRDLSASALAALDRASLTVLVVPAEVRAVGAARRLAGQLHDRGARTAAVIRGPAPGGLTAAEIADAVGIPLLTAMRPEPRLPITLDRGALRLRPRGPLSTTAKTILDTLLAPEPRTPSKAKA